MTNKLLKIVLHPASVFVAFVGAMACLFVVEGRWQHMLFVALIIGAIASLVYILSRRSAFSIYLSLVAVCGLTVMSIAKFRGKGFDLHIYDFAFTGTDPEALKFLLSEFSYLIVPILIAFTAASFALALIWKNERPTEHRFSHRLAPLILVSVGLPFAYPVNWSEPRYYYYLSGFNASSFFVSLLDIADRFSDEPIVARLSTSDDTLPFDPAVGCDGMDVKPDIYVVLSESATNFKQNYPQLNIQNAPINAFRSEDGKLRDLRVETFGGGTWVSNLSLMTGLSSLDFGWRAPYLTIQLQDRVKESLATLVKNCGYRAAAVIPMKHSFVNEGPFLESIGFDTVSGYDEIGASLYNHRDTFYYDAADNFIDEHQKSDGRPLFLQVQTMFAHSPFDEPRDDQIQYQDTPYSGNLGLNEHVRRVYIAQEDFRTFIEQRKAMQPDRPFVVLEFGDHQSSINLQMADDLSGGSSLLKRDSVAYKTHFSVHSHKFDLDLNRLDSATLDISFLGVAFMQAVGVPLSPMYQDLTALRVICDGKFDDCKNRNAVDEHLKRRVKSGILSLPTS